MYGAKRAEDETSICMGRIVWERIIQESKRPGQTIQGRNVPILYYSAYTSRIIVLAAGTRDTPASGAGYHCWRQYKK